MKSPKQNKSEGMSRRSRIWLAHTRQESTMAFNLIDLFNSLDTIDNLWGKEEPVTDLQ